MKRAIVNPPEGEARGAGYACLEQEQTLCGSAIHASRRPLDVQVQERCSITPASA
jgi:hypothetical protein